MNTNMVSNGSTARTRLHSLIRSNPGIHVQRVALLTGQSWNTCFYHLRVLESHKKLVSTKVQGRLCWFDRSSGAFPEKQAAALLRDRQNLRIIQQIITNEGPNQLQIAQQLGLAASTVYRRVVRLEDAGLIVRVPSNRSNLLFPSETLHDLAKRAGVLPAIGAGGRQRITVDVEDDEATVVESVAVRN